MAIAKLTTRVQGVGLLTHGGRPVGPAAVLVGRSGCGKSILGLQMAAHFATQSIPTLVLAVEESKEDLTTTGDALGLELTELQQDGALHMMDLTRPMEGPTVVSGDYDIYG